MLHPARQYLPNSKKYLFAGMMYLDEDVPMSPAERALPPSLLPRASLGHLVACGPACLFGAMHATRHLASRLAQTSMEGGGSHSISFFQTCCARLRRLLRGCRPSVGARTSTAWSADFGAGSHAAAAALSPVASFLFARHIACVTSAVNNLYVQEDAPSIPVAAAAAVV